MTLTDAGKELALFCERLFAEIPNVEQRIQKPQDISGVLRIGSYETLGVSFWPKALKQISKAYPYLKIKIMTENPQTLWRKLDEGLLDLLVDAEPPIAEKYFSKIIYSDKFALFSSGPISLTEDLPAFSYVQRATGKDGRFIRDYLAARDIAHDLLYDFDSFTSVKAITLEGLAIGVLPTTLAASELKKGQLQEITLKGLSSFGEHRICATCLEDRRKDSRIVAVIKTIKDVV